ncbi:hypothetical protein D9619_013196 [Psilocybe cf. subviscida]|uniref:ATP-dependent DNA helicase n=1 Tax=Psilocybe cf. subviscida TaxID=2480587 RepID=A0A8H5EYR4_9AGAR|nr:hypothetical protein D9619_013196 [Psilocybe cf. subviscida]
MSAYSQEIFGHDDDDSFPPLSMDQPVAGPSRLKGSSTPETSALKRGSASGQSNASSWSEKDSSKCSRVLTEVFGHSTFKGKQKEIVEAAYAGQDVLVVAPTGMGKSLCFQIPAIADERGLSVVVSPLLALMQNQVESLRQKSVEVASLNSQVGHIEQNETIRKIQLPDNPIKLLYITPERLLTRDFLQILDKVYKNGNLNRLVVDEAHCISEWGHNFREEYRHIGKFRTHHPDIPIMALTATATEAVRQDIIRSLKLDQNRLFFALHPFNRGNLFYEVRYLSNPQPQNQMADIHDYITTLYRRRGQPSSGIVYCRRRETCNELANFLRGKGLNAKPYHRGIPAATLDRTLQGWTHGIAGEPGSVDLVIATIAFGMGIDKGDVRYIIHYDLPKSLEGFYQETGRAGRDGLPSKCILYYSREDAIRVKQLACTGNPNRIRDDGEDGPSPTQRASGSFEALVSFAETSSTCRHVSICRYFGEVIDESDAGTLKEYCDKMCDICKYPEKTNNRTMKLSSKISAEGNVPSGPSARSRPNVIVNNHIHQHGPSNIGSSAFTMGDNGRISRKPSLGLHKRVADGLGEPVLKKVKVTAPLVTRPFSSASGLSKPFKAPAFVRKDAAKPALTIPQKPMIPDPPLARPAAKKEPPPIQIAETIPVVTSARQLQIEITEADHDEPAEIPVEEGEISPAIDLPLVDRSWKVEYSTKVSDGERKDAFDALRRGLHRTLMDSFSSDDYWDDIIFKAAMELENSAISLSSTKNGYVTRVDGMRDEIKTSMKDLRLWDCDGGDQEDLQEIIDCLRQCSSSPSRKGEAKT